MQCTRRDFLAAGGGIAATMGLFGLNVGNIWSQTTTSSKPAILGGDVRTLTGARSWPILEGSEEERVLTVLKSGQWCRSGGAGIDLEFEKEYAEMLGAKHCLVTNSGTSALVASLAALEVGPGDEVITSPYTFIATVNAILMHYALPIFVDSDLETFQLDAGKVENAFTENTKVCMPVHIGGAPADMGTILPLAEKRNVPVVEDACQAHLGKWGDRYLGTLGTTGCFSFQVTKNLSCGDGGAIVTNDTTLSNILYDCHNNGRGNIDSLDFRFHPLRAANFRMPEIMGAVLLAQIRNLQGYAEIRNANGLYLNSLLSKIPGVYPAKIYDGGTSAWHLYMFRIVPEEFGLNRDKVIEALAAEGINSGPGYGAMDWVTYVRQTYSTPAAKRVYSDKVLDDWSERIVLSNNEKLCSQAIWFTQDMMLLPRENMEIIAEALTRIQKNAGEIANS